VSSRNLTDSLERDHGLQFALLPEMRLIDRLNNETASSHADVDGDALSGVADAAGYKRYLTGTFGFVAPVERSIATTPEIERIVDLRRFNKAELLRRDLVAMRLTAQQINALPQCAVPLFNTPVEALGWAYFLERRTLSHNAVFRRFAATIPGEVAFASSYLKCYFGSVGEMWKAFGESLDTLNADDAAAVVDGARTAFRFYRSWQYPASREPSNTAAVQPAASGVTRGANEAASS
jgi:heme oxygenase